MTMRSEPTGEVREFPASKVFFSTTDRKGVIDTVNSTFVGLSRFPESELVGAPHNIIRHPDMPGAAFHIMWERLLSGLPMMAYVKNLAKDGAAYLTFSTVTPLGDGFISVRSAVARPDLWAPVERSYAQTRALETQWRLDGMSKADAARRGADDLQQRLAELGFATYDDVIRALVPAEVDARRAAAPPSAPVTMPGEALHDVVHAVTSLDAELAGMRRRYEDAVEVADALATAGARLAGGLQALAQASQSAADAAGTVAEDAPVLSTTARACVTMARDAAEHLEPMVGVLGTVRTAVLDLRARLALSVLHNDMAMIFAGEMSQGEVVGDPPRSVLHLGQAVATSVAEGESARQVTVDGLALVAGMVTAANEELLAFQRMLANWRAVVVRSGVSAQLAPYVTPIDERLSAGLSDMRALTQLAGSCEALREHIAASTLRDAAARLQSSAQRLASQAIA